MRLAANLSTQFSRGSWAARADEAAAGGYGLVEMQWPYGDIGAADLRAALDANGLAAVLVNAPVGDTAETRFGWASIPDERDAFRQSIETALTYAEIVGAGLIHVLAGCGDSDGARDTLIDNLAWAAAQATGTACLVIEAINRVDVPGYHLAGIDDAVAAIHSAGHRNLGLMVDFYHAHRNAEALPALIGAHAPLIKHVQLSDHPGRGEPGSGEIDFMPGLDALRACGYAGAIGCEFKPAGAPAACLDWTVGLRLTV